MQKGDRVKVKIDAGKSWHGTIVGESRDGHAWYIIKDGTKCSRGIHKDFCKGEPDADRHQRADHSCG